MNIIFYASNPKNNIIKALQEKISIHCISNAQKIMEHNPDIIYLHDITSVFITAPCIILNKNYSPEKRNTFREKTPYLIHI